MWLDLAGWGWTAVAVGSHLGSQLGYPVIMRVGRDVAARRMQCSDHRNAGAGPRARLRYE